ncbi:MAG: SRPBCC domain-containing protein [Rhodothermaceae bacterium]|nr:SRPBCC domain-containing protein [Rhodothermaceae bacterium]
MKDANSVSSNIQINAPASKVWEIITDPVYAKILGNEFDKNAYVESDWELGSEVYFKYTHKPEKPANTGTISKLVEEALIHVDYVFPGYGKYVETYSLQHENNVSVLQIDAGPYGADLDDQKVVWKNWLLKVKALSEGVILVPAVEIVP